jgi:hypothetical protein
MMALVIQKEKRKKKKNVSSGSNVVSFVLNALEDCV